MKRSLQSNFVDATDDPALPTDQAASYLGGLHPKTLLKLARLGEIASIQLAPKTRTANFPTPNA